MNIYYIFIIIFAVWGVFLTLKIYKEKKEEKNRPMVCPLGANCHSVLTSEFSSFLGIGLELFGTLYYGLIAVSYGTILIFPQLMTPYTAFILTGLTIGAFLFSIYLTFVQAFYLKNWCTWCLLSAGLSTLIFILTLIAVIAAEISFIPILEMFKTPITLLHLLGFALGVGGATISDIMFFKFLKDFKISEVEEKILRIMSQVIWVGLFIAVVSGIGLYLPNTETLNESSKFLVKSTIILIITLNGALLNLYISPNLVKMSFTENVVNVKKSATFRKIAFASGAVSFVSWYTAFILGSLKSVPLTYLELLSVYVGLVLIAIIGSQILEKTLWTKASRQKNIQKG
jgi:uncharacterized membrane protein